MRWPLFAAVLAAASVGVVYPLRACACVAPGAVLAAFADAPEDATAAEIEAGLALRLATWQYTVAMLPPALRQYCVANDVGGADCQVVTHEAPLFERGLELRFREDEQGFLGGVVVRPFARWRSGGWLGGA